MRDAMKLLLEAAESAKSAHEIHEICIDHIHAAAAVFEGSSSAGEVAAYLRTLADVIERLDEKERRSAMN